MKAFYFYNHQNKGLPLVRALESAGWTWTGQSASAEFILSDIDHPSRRKSLDAFHRQGKRIFVYPHSARPTLFHDFYGYPVYPHVAAGFQSAPGHVEILRRTGVEYPIEVVGWYLSPMRAFQPREKVRKVLFAPIHPTGSGHLSAIDRKINADAFKRLLNLVYSGDIDLTVRFICRLEQNGLWVNDFVKYVQGELDQSYKEIDEADLVVSHQTCAYIAIARGVPTVMMGEDVPPRAGCEELGDFHYSRSWDKYKDLLMYPLDILAEDDTRALLIRAAWSDYEIALWRARMIGQPFEPQRFVETLERYL